MSEGLIHLRIEPLDEGGDAATSPRQSSRATPEKRPPGRTGAGPRGRRSTAATPGRAGLDGARDVRVVGKSAGLEL